MCGIVGYIGKKEAYPILIKGLRRLEYRGYDSAGVALLNEGGSLNVYKTKGKVDNLTEYCSDKDVSGHVGIAHTRWATHGEPSSRNAHPHYSESHNLAIIHNGIIENYADIKVKLQEKGIKFQSDTDTEVLVQLVEYIMVKKQLSLLEAVQVALIVAIVCIFCILYKIVCKELLPAEKLRCLDEIRRILQNGIQVIRPDQTRSQNQPFK